MKTLRIVSMIVMVIITIFFVVYAKIQTNYAVAALEEAEIQKQLAEESIKRAEEQEKMAYEMAGQARMAENQYQMIKKELEDCQNP